MRFDLRRWRGRLGGGASLAVVVALSPGARAAAGEVTSDTAAQFYDVRSPTGEVVLMRERMTTTLGIAAYDLVDRPADGSLGPEWTFRARARYDADFGMGGGETDHTNLAAFIPGLHPQNVDIMYAYVEGRRLLHGLLGVRLGRQYITDALGFWSFDGGEARIVSRFHTALELYGGLEVRGGMPISSGRFEADGVWRGDRSGYDPAAYPSFQQANIAPAFGASLESTGVSWLHARLSYRRVENTGTSNVGEFGGPAATYTGMRVSREQLGASAEGTWGEHAGVKAALVYDLYRDDLTSLYVSLDGRITPRFTVSLDYDYFRPSFDGDSIWNFFQGEPTSDIGLRSSLRLTDRLSATARAHVRMFDVSTAPESPTASPNIVASTPGSIFPSSGVSFDDGFDASLRYRSGLTSAGARASAQLGTQGDRIGGDAFVDRTYDHFFGGLRASLFQWDDKLRPDRSALSAGYVASLGYKFAERSRGSVEWEHEMNRLSGQRFRIVFWLTVAGGGR